MNQDNEAKFIDFYESNSDAVFRFVLLKVDGKETALDLTQEAFLKYWQVTQKQEVDNGRAYIFSVARNLVIDWYRKKKPESLDALENFDIPADSLDIDKFAEGREALGKISELPLQYREVIYLRFVEDLSPEEIAFMYKENANAVSVRIHRALEALRKILKIDKY